MTEDAGIALDENCFTALKLALQKINSSIAA
jgi:hypothetical protein